MNSNIKKYLIIFFISFLFLDLCLFFILKKKEGVFNIETVNIPFKGLLKKSQIMYSDKNNSAGDGHLIFYAPKNTVVFPIFSGEVERISPVKNMTDVIIYSKLTKTRASYMIYGKINKIKERQQVSLDDEIAVLDDPGKGPELVGGANLAIWIYDKNGGTIDLKPLVDRITK